ncbi:hypothetical protein ACFSBZ_09895 [Amnibacterium flavum]|uniref:hypothetical protein n=1 Tax=Amnibacterium flavum TaxID=2173173 RepID=UPI00196B5DCF|nr:hypothetical protein [Amnibacterium flavum]
MRVLLKLILDCEPEAAWRAIQSPTVFREASLPLLTFRSLEPNGFPNRWEEGAHPIRMSIAGVPLGSQTIGIEFPERRHEGVQILRDNGAGLTGLNTVFDKWDHRMAIAADPAGTGKTLYRDRLSFSAGPLTLAVWPSMWALWQLRGARLTALAPSWTHPATETSAGTEPVPGDDEAAAA